MARNKNLNQKIDTQVINLQEIKDAASNESYKRKNNDPLIILFLGLFMIASGFAYPMIMRAIDGEEVVVPEQDAPAVDNNKVANPATLSCTKTITTPDFTTIHTDNYAFNESGLVSVTKKVERTALTDAGQSEVSTIASVYESLKSSLTAANINNSINKMPDNKYFSAQTILEYDIFDKTKYSPPVGSVDIGEKYTKSTNAEDIKKTLANDSYICK